MEVAVRAGVPAVRSTLRTKGVRMKSGELKVRGAGYPCSADVFTGDSTCLP
jgi:hypothetical protein